MNYNGTAIEKQISNWPCCKAKAADSVPGGKGKACAKRYK